MLQDIHHALRLMARQKAFTAAALVTLALGIGANTAIFSVVYGVLLRPLPYPDSERLVRVSEVHPGGTPIVRWPMISNLAFHAWRTGPRTLEGLGAYSAIAFTLTGQADAVRVSGAALSPSIFAMLRVRPAAGRLFQEQDAAEGAPDIVVLGYRFWQERFGGLASSIGSALRLDGRPFTIVGVTPPGFSFPTRDARLYTVNRVPTPAALGRVSIVSAIGLLRAGTTAEQAAAEGTAAARSGGPRHLSSEILFGKGGPPVVHVRPLVEEMTARVGPALVVLLAGVGVVLLIACANVTNLLLSRGVGRARELSVRAAIGAGQGRLARQLMTETLTLSAAGGALGIALAWVLMRALPVLAPEDFPRLDDVRLDGVALAFSVAVSLAAGLVAGVVPAARLARGTLLSGLREGTGASGSAQSRRLGSGLLVAEAALAVVLLVAAGLLGRSFFRLLDVNPGYDSSNVLMAGVYLQAPGAEGQQAQTDREEIFAQALLDRVRALPGVSAAGAGNMAPLVPNTAVMMLTLTGDAPQTITARALSYVITPEWTAALGMRVREGRGFVPADLAGGVRPVLVNEEFVRAYLNDGRPVAGRRFTQPNRPEPFEIVGVVGNILKDGLDARPQPELYNLPRDGFGLPLRAMQLAVRTSGDPLAIAPALRRIVRELDRQAAIDEIETLGSRVSASIAEPRFAAAVLGAFALLALALAAVGLYGVLSYQVSQRRRELGVRTALGASRGDIVRLVLRQGLGVTVAGLVAGLAAAAWLTRLMQGLLFGVTPHDAVAFGVAPVVLLAVALVATLVPARRAASTDPIEALRCE